MKILFIFFLCFISFPSYAEIFLPDQKIASTAYKNKDYKTAYKHWSALAPYNNDKALLGLGRLYARGLGVEQNHNRAINYFKKSANLGNARAYFEIARSYERGRGVPKDIKKAQKWHKLSAHNGYQRANDKLNDMGLAPIESKNKQRKSNLNLRYSLKSQLALEENLSLGQDNDSSTAFINEAQVTARYEPLQDIRLQTQIRALHSTGSATSIDPNENEEIMDESFVEIRQAFMEWKSINDIQPLSFRLGRQRFSEDRRLLWNDELDAAKIAFDTSLTSGFFALGNNFSDYRFGDDQDFEEDEKDRLRLLGELTHSLSPKTNWELRFLYENDYSDQPSVGTIFQSEDLDRVDQNLLWIGARTTGQTINDLYYDLSLIGVTGTEDISQSSSIGNNQRQITSNQKRDVRAFAFDANIKKLIGNALTAHIGYAYGSGDDGKGTNTSFRQTDLQTNTSKFERQPWQSAKRHYGEVLRPELSNIHILQLGVHCPIFDHHDLDVTYYNYWRANEDTDIGRNGIDQNLSDNGHHVGQAFDIVSTLNLPKILKLDTPALDQSVLRLRAGAFYSDDTYGTNKNEFAFITNAQLGIKF